MIRPRYIPFYTWFFSHYTRIGVRRHFSSVQIRGDFTDRGKAILMIGNHFSWWDGFLAHYLNMQLLSRRFNVMMLEEELKKRMFLNKIGAFSINKKSRTAIDSINLVRELLTDRQNLVVYYPQGRFQSLYDQVIHFENGVNKIFKGMDPESFQVFLYAAMVDYLSEKKPQLTFYIGEYVVGHAAEEDIETAYNRHYKEAAALQNLSI